jgi:hypothetical protein
VAAAIAEVGRNGPRHGIVKRRGAFGAVVLLASAAVAARESTMSIGQFVQVHGITFRVGPWALAPGRFSEAALRGLVRDDVARVRLPGLPDELNVRVLDGEKVDAFVAALPQLDAASIAAIANRALALDRIELPLQCWSAVSAARIRAGYRLVPLPDHADAGVAAVATTLEADADEALRRIALARAAVAERDRSLERLRAQGPGAGAADAILALQRERQAAVFTWAWVARALAARRPPVPGATALDAEASEAMRHEVIGPWLDTMPVPPAEGAPPGGVLPGAPG